MGLEWEKEKRYQKLFYFFFKGEDRKDGERSWQTQGVIDFEEYSVRRRKANSKQTHQSFQGLIIILHLRYIQCTAISMDWNILLLKHVDSVWQFDLNGIFVDY